MIVGGEAIREYLSTCPGDAPKAEMGDGASRVLEAVQTSIEMAAAFVSFVLRSEPGLMTATSALGATWCLVNSWKKP